MAVCLSVRWPGGAHRFAHDLAGVLAQLRSGADPPISYLS
jgi:hypothetical protein